MDLINNGFFGSWSKRLHWTYLYLFGFYKVYCIIFLFMYMSLSTILEICHSKFIITK